MSSVILCRQLSDGGSGYSFILCRAVNPIASLLERNIVVRDWLLRRYRLFVFRLAFVRSALAAEQDQVFGVDLGHVMFHAVLVPRARLYLAFDEKLMAFFDVLLGNLRQLRPGDYVVPLSLIDPFVGLVFVAFVGCQRELCNHRPVG